MIDFEMCSYAKVEAIDAAPVLFNFLSYLNEEMAEEDQKSLISAVGAQYQNIIEFFHSDEEELLQLSTELRKTAGNTAARITILWYLSCFGSEMARTQLISALKGVRLVAKHSGSGIRKKLDDALASWGVSDFQNAMASKAFNQPPLLDEPKIEVVVLDKIGDDQGREGKELAKRYSSLIGKPIALKGDISNIPASMDRMQSIFPWAENAIEAVFRQLALMKFNKANLTHVKIPPLLIVGSPGSGKTKFMTALMEELSLPFSLIACGGTADSGGLLATARGWATSRASGPVQAMLEHKCANPGFILDELDKASSPERPGSNGNVSGALLTMINGDARYYDSCLMADVDFSAISFLATANKTDTISEPLLDRFEVIHMDSPKRCHFDAIFSVMKAEEGARVELDPSKLPQIDDWEVDVLRDILESPGSSIRQVKKTYRMLIGQKALGLEKYTTSSMMPEMNGIS